MTKNIVIVLLAFCCVALAFAVQTERNAGEDRSLSAADYGGLIALRDVLTPEEYQKEVLPFLQKAKADGKATYRQLSELDARLGNLSARVLDAAEKVRPQEALLRAWENTKQGANDLGSQLGRSMGEALDEFSRMMNEAVPTRPSPSAPPAKPVNPAAPLDPLAPSQI